MVVKVFYKSLMLPTPADGHLLSPYGGMYLFGLQQNCYEKYIQ